MGDELNISTLFLKDKQTRHQWESLLHHHGILSVTDKDILMLDQTFGIYDNQQLVATISTASNVLKYLVIEEEYRENGRLFNLLVSHAINVLASQEIFHVLVFTKLDYAKSFQYLGFFNIMTTEYGVFLEKGDQSIDTFLSQLPLVIGDYTISAIVMNANPFTKGHLYLIEEALKKSDYVYVFVVSANQSLFTSEERYQLVCQGVENLERVIVCQGGEYMVSLATFPSYFLKNKEDIISHQTQLDALLFKEYIAKTLHITKRLLGEEPLSETTKHYNEALLTYLPPEIEVEIIPRKTMNNHQVISATKVRECIQIGDLKRIKQLVPTTTYDFIVEHLDELQERLDNN
ncbi:[citrate (pro-3S)-lyase] ligase [Vagococcus bubulae]|uniref:[Citrate [pro-3S]-lyase] ligase n=1 Tax=Vagococcus bubulae TaxID=1977868 RepID=A0A429ZNS8_9ENTE|nr:[citrate (pro-3S)-lyase] ligase [Vagococcus bubulae]RST95326.1 [citrate (pro-3S)-lyase] ligase [Vagococcus bubulae]